jgi:hypothetical protein
MRRKRSTIVMVILGIIAMIVVVGAGLGTWFFLSVFDSVDADEALAEQTFAEAQARFKGQQPLLQLENGGFVILRKAPAAAQARDLQSVHALTWTPGDGTLTRMVLPFWLVRLQNSAVDVAFTSDGAPISLTVEDMERYGPALYLDHSEEDGSRTLVWTD